MQLATIVRHDELRPAMAIGNDILDFRAAAKILPHCERVANSMFEIVSGGDEVVRLLQDIAGQVAGHEISLRDAGALVPVAETKFAAPLPNPGMVLSIGANYHEHLREMNTVAPETPMGFYKSVASIIGHGDAIILPASNPDMVDWEGEFSVVIGRPCHHVNEAESLDYVAGYTIINDVSARDWVAPAFNAQGMIGQIVAWEHNILGKLFPTFCPMGPYIVTADEISNPDNLRLETRLNGIVMQSSNTSDLVFNVPKIIAYYSQFIQFRPGDIITTGSPSGVGYGRDPKLFMKPGDVVEVEIEGLGTLRNDIGGA